MTFDERLAAIHVIQRFVMMSRTLLPMFSDLTNRRRLSQEEFEQVEQIQEVYENFKADPTVSEDLINSPIIGLIQQTYDWIKYHWGESPQNSKEYLAFVDESDRLIFQWERANLN